MLNAFFILFLMAAHKLAIVALINAISAIPVLIALMIVWVSSQQKTDVEGIGFASRWAKKVFWFGLICACVFAILPNKAESYTGIALLISVEGYEKFENTRMGRAALNYLEGASPHMNANIHIIEKPAQP